MTIGNYSIIYADPPWQYQRSKVQGAAENHYPTMGIDELCALPVADLAAPDSALFLWATFPQLPEALRLIEAWGFRYKSVAFVWLKKNKKAFSWIKGDLSEMFAWYKDHADYIKLHNNTRSIVEEILEMIRTKLTEVENAEN